MAQIVRDEDNINEFASYSSDPCQDLLISIGKRLAYQRETHEESIENIAKDLRIRSSMLLAIEEGRIEEFPGDSYYYGFARNYANALAVDITDDIKKYRHLRENQEDRTNTNNKLANVVVNSFGDRTKIAAATIASTSNPIPDPVKVGRRNPSEVVGESSHLIKQMMAGSQHKNRNLAFVIAFACVLVLGYALYLLFTGTDSSAPKVVESSTEQPLDNLDEILGTAVTEQAVAAPESTSVFRVSKDVVQEAEIVAAKPVKAPARTGLEYGNPVNSRVAIRSTTGSWISVVDINQVDVEAGRTGEIFARQLRRNDVYHAPLGDQIFVKAGDASGLQLVVDGKAQGVMGRAGQVRFSSLNPDSILRGENFGDGISLNDVLEAVKRAQSR